MEHIIVTYIDIILNVFLPEMIGVLYSKNMIFFLDKLAN